MTLPLRYILAAPEGTPDHEEAPMVIVMHGRGADANDLADIAPVVDAGAGFRYVFPNAPKPWEAAPGMTFGFTWFDGWPPRGNSIAESRALLLEFIDGVTKRYPTPPGKLVVAGFSQGALMALDAGLRVDPPVAGVVVMSGGLYEEDLSHLRAKRTVPVLIVHGTMDDVVPVNAARRARRVLEEHGFDPEFHEFPMGHHLTPESMEVVASFVRRVLGNAEPAGERKPRPV